MSYGYSPSYPPRRYTGRMIFRDAALGVGLTVGYAGIVAIAFTLGTRHGAKPAAVPNPNPTEFVMLCQPIEPEPGPVRPVAVIHEPTPTICRGVMK
jgi:hypothetical protein